LAIKAGQILHAMNSFVIDRIQTATANLNIPTERVFELGNYQSVAVIRDLPDLTFNLECLDVDTEVEAILTGSAAPLDDPDGTKYTLAVNRPMDIISPMKSAQGAFDIVRGAAIPQLTLESANYRYGLRDNAGETFNLRGDSLFWIPGTPYLQTHGPGLPAPVPDGTIDAFPFVNTALLYTEQGQSRYALNVSVNGVRATPDVDYAETAAGITFTTPPPAGAIVRMVYGSATAASYPQSVHEGVTVKPAAIRGKDIQVYIGLEGGQPYRWDGVQAFNVDFALTLEDVFEFGNPRAVERDRTDAPAVTGSLDLLPISTARLFDKLSRITGVPGTDIIGPQSSVALPIEIRLLNPESGGTTDPLTPPGTVLKTLYVPDARFTIPGYDGRVQANMAPTLNFESDEGILEVFKGTRV
jgi:hypothetical protein